MTGRIKPARITAAQFQESPGVEDWRVLSDVATTRFQTGSFATGVALINKIGHLADEADHHPDVELRYPEVVVRLETHEIGGLSERDVALARQISSAARELDILAVAPTQPDG